MKKIFETFSTKVTSAEGGLSALYWRVFNYPYLGSHRSNL